MTSLIAAPLIGIHIKVLFNFHFKHIIWHVCGIIHLLCIAILFIHRSFWIRAEWRNKKNYYRVHVGLCSDPRQNRIFDTGKIKKENFMPKIYHIRISTARGSSGQWQFASGKYRSDCSSVIKFISIKFNEKTSTHDRKCYNHRPINDILVGCPFHEKDF